MKEILVNGIDGYIKIFYDTQNIEIASSGFYANGKLNINRNELFAMKIEFDECIECGSEEYYKAMYRCNNKLFGFELRCDGRNDFVYLLGIYSKDDTQSHRIEFEFELKKDEIKKVISTINELL